MRQSNKILNRTLQLLLTSPARPAFCQMRRDLLRLAPAQLAV
jgi:hypothetical protein